MPDVSADYFTDVIPASFVRALVERYETGQRCGVEAVEVDALLEELYAILRECQ